MAIQINDLPEITINGEKMEDYVFTDMILNKELLKPNEFRFTMRKKDLSKTASDIAFELCDKLLGAKVECKVKTLRRSEEQEEVGEELAFTGLIFNANTQREIMGKGMVVNCVAYSPDYLLIDSPNYNFFEEKNLKEIIDEIVADYKEALEVEVIPKMAEVIHFTAQFKENTYQFISRLAQRWGEFLYFEDGKMVFGKMKQTDPVELYPDVDILGYYYDLNMESIDTGFSYWDYYTTDGPTCEAETIRSLDSKESHKLTETVMAHAYDLYPTWTLEEAQCVPAGTSRIDHATEVAKSQYYYKKARMMMCKAVTNRCDLKLGSVVVIKEYADTDTGVELKSHEPLQIIGIRYQWDINGHFQNEFTAIPSTLEYPPYLNPNLYPKSGVQHAVVTDVDDAEGHMGRVKVTFHMGGLQTPWIRVARPYAGTDQGVIFTPAKNQEVLVGFVNDNVEQPFVIGAVHNAIQKPKVDWDCTGNTIKGIRTANHEILICDSNDGNGYIRISDYDNRHFDIVLDADSKTITVKSAGDIIFEAGNDISFKAKHHINMRAGHRLVEKVGTSLEQHVGRDALIDIGHHYNQHVAGHAEVTIDGKTLLHAQDDFWISGQKLVKVYSQDTVVCHGKEDATIYSEDSLCVLGNNNVCIRSKVTDIDADLINLGE